ncbi:MAG: AMP-binding protein, partial [Pseudomonadota bacterium]|nr:AMP-binding protein [Pseudomonadota bacterium]
MTEQVKRAIATGETLKDKYPVGVQWELSNIKALQHKNVADLLTEGLRRNPSGTAISFMGNKISYSELNDLVNHAAKGLQEMGVEKGTKVGLHMPNTPYYPIMFMAALRIGATVVNFSPLYNEDELAAQIKDSDTEVMVTLNLNDFIDKSVSLKKQGVLKSIVKCDLQDMLPSIKKTAFNLLKSSEVRGDTEHSVNFNDIIQNDGNVETAKVSPDDIAVLQYTSGSTGVPKGAMLTHFNLAANTTQVCGFFGENNMKPPGATNIGYASEKILATIPYFHVYGMMTAMINPLQMGNEIIIIPNPRDIPGTLATIDKEKPSITPLVPTLIRAFDEHPKTAWQ